MWKLNSPDTTQAARELLRGLLRLDGKPVSHKPTAAQRNGVRKLYNRYDAALGAPSPTLKGVRFAKAFRDAVKAAYNEVQEDGRLSDLRARLKNVQGQCPYCGIGEIGDLDHFLPQTTYNLLSVYARNLIPCCHKCNRAKGTLASPTPTEHLAHAYFDAFPPERFFFAEVSVSPAGLKTRFYIEKSVAMTQAFADRLTFQVQRFELNKRYPAVVNSYLGGQKEWIEQAGRAGLPALRATLVGQRDSLARQFALNDWRTALMYALSESDDFCDGGYRFCFGAPHPGA